MRVGMGAAKFCELHQLRRYVSTQVSLIAVSNECRAFGLTGPRLKLPVRESTSAKLRQT
jgi:hypothetical protein